MSATKTRLQHLLYYAKNEIKEAEDELDEREFSKYCAFLIIHLTAKHLEPEA